MPNYFSKKYWQTLFCMLYWICGKQTKKQIKQIFVLLFSSKFCNYWLSWINSKTTSFFPFFNFFFIFCAKASPRGEAFRVKKAFYKGNVYEYTKRKFKYKKGFQKKNCYNFLYLRCRLCGSVQLIRSCVGRMDVIYRLRFDFCISQSCGRNVFRRNRLFQT